MLTALDAYAVGVAALAARCGRARKEDDVQAGAGIELHAKPGAVVRAGEPLMTLHTDSPDRFDRARQVLHGSSRSHRRFAARPVAPLVIDRIDADA